MLFMYVIGLLSMRVKSTVLLSITCAALVLASSLIFGAELPRAGTGAVFYFLLCLPWFWLLEKTSETIFMWFMIFLPGPFAISFAVIAADIAMFGQVPTT